MASKICAVLLFAPFASALRSSRQNVSRSTSRAGTVSELYTFGTPKVSVPALRNPADRNGCFAGSRFINVKTNYGRLNEVDCFTPIFQGPWNHVMMPVMKVDQNGNVKEHPCGWKGSMIWETPNCLLHGGELYAERASKVEKLHTLVEVGLRQSYNHVKHDVAIVVGKLGWNLVGSAWSNGFLSKQVAHLMQDPSTLDCILTFEGTSGLGDWKRNAAIELVDFCGLPERFHMGFTEATRVMAGDAKFQQRIRGNLGKCRKVSAVGHSMGGAIAALFAACANSRASVFGKSDFDIMSWTQEEPALLPAVRL